jgi:predicted NBD/HSP70 family sugar kinase
MSDTPGAIGQSAGKVSTMCLDCGCGELNESHGDSRHITMDSIQSAAQASDISLEEAIRNIADGLSQAQASTEQTTSSSAASD